MGPEQRAVPKMRLGVFRASRQVVGTDAFRVLMASCAIVRCELVFWGDLFEYTAISPQFEEVAEGCMPEHYQWIFRREGPLDQLTAVAVKVEAGTELSVDGIVAGLRRRGVTLK